MKPLFDEIDRRIITDFYRHPSYWHKPIIVTQYEMAKAKKELCKQLKKTYIYKILCYENSKRN